MFIIMESESFLNIERILRDAESLLKARFNVVKITNHFIANNEDDAYGHNLKYDEVLPIVTELCNEMNRAERRANAEILAAMRRVFNGPAFASLRAATGARFLR